MAVDHREAFLKVWAATPSPSTLFLQARLAGGAIMKRSSSWVEPRSPSAFRTDLHATTRISVSRLSLNLAVMCKVRAAQAPLRKAGPRTHPLNAENPTLYRRVDFLGLRPASTSSAQPRGCRRSCKPSPLHRGRLRRSAAQLLPKAGRRRSCSGEGPSGRISAARRDACRHEVPARHRVGVHT